MDIRFRGWIATLIFIPGIQSAVAGADRVYTQPWYDFLDQSEMTLSLKNYWARLSEDETESRKVHNAWGQGAEVSFHSGYIAGILGADVTWTKAVKLAASDYFDTRGVLYDSRHQSNKRSAAGYQKFTQRNLRLQYKFADTDLKARVGWMPLKNFGVITASRRLSLTSYSGWYGDISYNNYRLQGES